MTDPQNTANPITQASNLPRRFDSTLPRVKPLKGMPDYDIWLFKVETTLQQHNLHELIDSTIPRPSDTDPKHEHWRKLSKLVKTWLAHQLGKPMIRAFLCTRARLEFADDFMHAIEKLVLGEPGLAWTKAANIQRADYANVDHFVAALKMRVRYSNKVDKRIKPAFATEILFAAVRGEIKGYVDVVSARLSAEDKDNMSWDTFFRFCEEVSAFSYEHASDEEVKEDTMASETVAVEDGG